MNQKMIYGSPVSSIIAFAIPLVIGNLFQQLYSIVDLIIVGNFVSEAALAAVGNASTVTMFFISLVIGLSMGCSVVIAQLFGAKKVPKLLTSIYTSIISMAALGFICIGVGLIICRPLLILMNTPGEILEDAATYLDIYILALPGVFVYNISNSTFNALGKSKMPLIFLIFSSLLNVFLDLWFVAGLSWGVAGAAWATLISQYLAAVLAFVSAMIYIRKHFKTDESYKKYEFITLRNILKIAIPTCVQQSIVSLGNLAFQALINTFGTDVIAGFTAAFKVDGIAIVPIIQISQATSTFTAQNIGAKKPERVKTGLITSFAMDAILWIVMAAILLLFGQIFVGLFMSSTSGANAIIFGTEYTKFVSCFYIVFALMNTMSSCLRGAGDIKWSLISVAANFVTRLIVSYTIVYCIFNSYKVIYFAIPIGWLVGGLIALTRFLKGKWKTKSIVDKV